MEMQKHLPQVDMDKLRIVLDTKERYMNVLSDLLLRVEEQAPSSIETEELNSYQQTIHAQDEQITRLENEVHQLRRQLSSLTEA